MAWDEATPTDVEISKLAAEFTDTKVDVGDTFATLASTMKYADTRFVVGSFTRDLTTAAGAQTVTGLVITPKAIILFPLVSDSTKVAWGMDDVTTHFCTYLGYDGNYGAATTRSIYLSQTVAIYSRAYISAFAADQFILTWDKTGAPTGTATIGYIAFR